MHNFKAQMNYARFPKKELKKYCENIKKKNPKGTLESVKLIVFQ